MREILAKLIQLQAIDDDGRGFLEERDSLRANIQQLKALLERMDAALEEKRGKLAEATRFYKEKDLELKSDADKVVKAKTKLQAVTKNKEYMAMQKEIESLRTANLAREEEILKLATAMEEFKTSVATEEKEISARQSELKKVEKANASRLNALQKELDAITARKKEVSIGLKPALVSRYNRINKARQGIGIVPVTNNSCTGCNFFTPPQQVVRLRKVDTLEVCRNCSRMLYWLDTPDEEDADEAAAPA